MTNLHILLATASLAIAGFGIPLSAQQPGIAGTWITPPEHVASAPLPEQGRKGTGVKGASSIRISQAGDTIMWTGNGLTYKYLLDGTETVNCGSSQGTCFPNKCRAWRKDAILTTSCRQKTESGREIITTQRAWLDADGNLQLTGRVVTQGITTTVHSTYVRKGDYVF